MKKGVILTAILVFVCYAGTISIAQEYQLNGRYAVGFNLGMYAVSKSANTVSINGMNTDVSASGFAGNMSLSYWFKENLSLQLSAGMLTGSANVSVNAFNSTQQASAVFPLLLGLNYYFTDPTTADAVRPFVGASIGMYVGSEAQNTTLGQKVHSENAIGGHARVGIDFLLGNHFILGANLGYNVMSNFTNPVAGKNNFSGADFFFRLNYVF